MATLKCGRYGETLEIELESGRDWYRTTCPRCGDRIEITFFDGFLDD